MLASVLVDPKRKDSILFLTAQVDSNKQVTSNPKTIVLRLLDLMKLPIVVEFNIGCKDKRLKGKTASNNYIR